MKSRIKKILCPIDFSESSIKAMEYAAMLSKELECSLTLWNIYEMTILDERSFAKSLTTNSTNRQDELSVILQDWCEEIKEDYAIPCGYVVSPNSYSVKEVLALYTDGENFDLIIAGTNENDTIYEFFFSTNSYRIIQEINCPIMFIPNNKEFNELKSVVFASDNKSLDSTWPLKIAEAINASFFSPFRGITNSKSEEYVSFETVDSPTKNNLKVFGQKIVKPIKANYNQQQIIEKNADLVIVSAKNTFWFEELFLKLLRKYATDGIKLPILVFNRTRNRVEEQLI